MELLVSGEREFKGYCAAQLAASDFNMAHEMFQFGSLLFPEKEEENDATVLVLPQKAILCPVPAAVKTGDAEGQ